jgi:hypothetical protein
MLRLVALEGLGLTPDGWALWQGAVSLVEQRTYSYFSGTPILAWPPVYPLYLGLSILAFGPTALALVVRNGVLMVVQVAAWNRFARLIVDFPEGRRFAAHRIVLAAFIALFATINQRNVTSHNLAYTLLPFYLGAVWKYALGRSEKIPPMLVLGAVLPLTHNMALAFVGAGAFVIAVHRPHSVHRVVVASLIVATAVASCLLVGVGFGFAAGHVIGLGRGRYILAEYFWQMAEGTGWLLAPAAHGLSFVALISVLALASLLARNEKASALRAGLLFVACGAAAIIALFNLVWIFNELYGVYLLFIPFVLPLAFVVGSHRRPIAARQRLDVHALGFTESHECTAFVPLRAYLKPAYRAGLPVETTRGLLIAPPSFEDRGLWGLYRPDVDCQPR